MRPTSCLACGADLPLGARSDRRYCAGRCRMRALRIRSGAGVIRRERSAERRASTEGKRLRSTSRVLATLREELRCEIEENKHLDATVKRLQREIDEATEARRDAEELTEQLVSTLKSIGEQRSLSGGHRALRQQISDHSAGFSSRSRKLAVAQIEWNTDRVRIASLQDSLRKRGTWDGIAEAVIGVAAILNAPQKPHRSAPAEAKDATAAASLDEPDWAAHVARAKDKGWRPMIDLLVQRKREELEAEDALAQHPWRKGRTVTAHALPARANFDELAAREALRVRAQYHAHPPPERPVPVSWLKPHHKLDMRSEQDLLRRTRQRINDLRRQLSS